MGDQCLYKVLPAESVAKCKYKVIKKQKSYLEALPVVLKACGANLRKNATPTADSRRRFLLPLP
jgi:hypothetical protein